MGYRMVSSLEGPHLSIARKDWWGTGQHSTEREAIAPSGALAWSTFLSLARRFSVRLGASSKRRVKGDENFEQKQQWSSPAPAHGRVLFLPRDIIVNWFVA